MSTLTIESTIFTVDQLIEKMEQDELMQIAFAGRSNVGKSSLINALAGRKQLAKISSTPGKTRSLNYYLVSPESFYLVDLPGYGYARCSHEERNKWAKLIEYYLLNSARLVALALLIDSRIPPQQADKDLANFAYNNNIPILPVLTKIDQCKQREVAAIEKQWTLLLNGIQPHPVSAKNGRGIEGLWNKVYSYF